MVSVIKLTTGDGPGLVFISFAGSIHGNGGRREYHCHIRSLVAITDEWAFETRARGMASRAVDARL